MVVRDGRDVWNPESGQALFDFELAELARGAATLPLRVPAAAEDDLTSRRGARTGTSAAPSWRRDSPEEAMAAYRRALEIDPDLADAHVNLGRLLHERGETAEAERHYRLALPPGRRTPPPPSTSASSSRTSAGCARPPTPTWPPSTLDRTLADAHYNLAGIYEQLGEPEAAFRHLRTYRHADHGLSRARPTGSASRSAESSRSDCTISL